MENRRIVSPMFLDRVAEAPMRLARDGDIVIGCGTGPGEQIESVAPIHRALAAEVGSATGAGARPVAILGDCCQTIGVMKGLEQGGVKTSLIWLDAHGDFNTWETTPSGFLGGMPLAMMTGRGDQRMMKAVGLSPIADERVHLCDARDLDPGEKELVASSGLRHWRLLGDLVNNLPAGPLYVHFDSDIIASEFAPAFLYAVRNGPSPEETRKALAAIEATGRVVAISTTAGWDTAKDKDLATERAVAHAFSGLSVD